MKKVKKSILFLMFFACFCMLQHTNRVYANELDWQLKVESEVLEKINENPEQEIPVYLFLQNYEKRELNNKLSQKGYDSELYSDPEKFEKILAPEIANEVVQEVGFEKAYEKDESVAFVEEPTGYNMLNKFCDWDYLGAAPSLVSEAIAQNVDEYKQIKNECVQDLCSAYNQAFIDKCEINEEDIIFNGELVRILIVKASPDEIECYANQDEVASISYYEDISMESDMSIALPQVGADSISGTKKSGYTGSGVSIGIIEVNGKYNSSNPHLSGKSKLRYIQNSNNSKNFQVNDHATKVTSIICGNKVTVKNSSKTYGTYEGIVPDAVVYQVATENFQDLYVAIQQLILMGVDVINFSGGSTLPSGKYTSIEKTVDMLVYGNDIVYINSAGNQSDFTNPVSTVVAPALALNIISVGSLETESVLRTALSQPYAVSDFSSYLEASYLPNKPDLSAPGSNITTADSYTQIDTASGTSFSAPIVTGVIAQMLQANPSLCASPNLVKSKLLLAADGSKVSSVNNSFRGNLQRDRSGAGMVDAKESVTAAKSSNYKEINYSSQQQVINSRYYSAGQKVRVVMVINNPDYKDIAYATDMDDADLIFVNSSGSTVARSVSTVNNVEIIEYTIPSSGNYSIRVNGNGNVKNPKAVPKISVSWKIS